MHIYSNFVRRPDDLSPAERLLAAALRRAVADLRYAHQRYQAARFLAEFDLLHSLPTGETIEVGGQQHERER